MRYYRAQRLSLLDQPRLAWFAAHERNEHWLIQSRQGRFLHDQQRLNLHQAVCMHNAIDRAIAAPVPQAQPVQLCTHDLDVLFTENRAYTEEKVEVHMTALPGSYQSTTRLTARGMQFFLLTSKMEFLHQVQSTWLPAFSH